MTVATQISRPHSDVGAAHATGTTAHEAPIVRRAQPPPWPSTAMAGSHRATFHQSTGKSTASNASTVTAFGLSVEFVDVPYHDRPASDSATASITPVAHSEPKSEHGICSPSLIVHHGFISISMPSFVNPTTRSHWNHQIGLVVDFVSLALVPQMMVEVH